MTDITNTNDKKIAPAPVAVFVYKRADHTEAMLNSLADCTLAKETEVFIFADGIKNSQDLEVFARDTEDIRKVRELISESRWAECFKSVSIKASQDNRGLANSIIAGVTDVIGRYGKIIVLEDDLVVSKDFLEYMNAALDYFKDNAGIFSVTGWSYPVKFKNYNKDSWAFYRACSWGWGTWKDRWANVEFDPLKADFEGKLNNEAWCRQFARGGNDLPGMLRLQLAGKRDSWAIRWNAAASDMDMLTIYPVKSRIMNNGRDGSGTHCGQAAYVQSEIEYPIDAEGYTSPNYDFADIELNPSLAKQAWYFESDTIDKKIKRNLRKIFVEHRIPDFLKTRSRED